MLNHLEVLGPLLIFSGYDALVTNLLGVDVPHHDGLRREAGPLGEGYVEARLPGHVAELVVR